MTEHIPTAATEPAESDAAAAVVVGSANLDLVYRVAHLPRPGETLLATGASRHPGGKGNNQVIAVARAGAAACFVAAIGTDGDGDELLATLDAAGVASRVRRVDERTGTALIVVDDAAENTIVVDSGANATLVELDDGDRAAIAAASVVLLQLEIPDTTVLEAATVARLHDTTVVLNAAPFRPLSAELLALVDVLVVNEGEAAELGAEALASVPAAIITRGPDGAEVRDSGDEPVVVPAPKVEAVDTTGAGDTFCGALVAALCEQRPLVEAARFAVAAGALAVQQLGATTSIPHRIDIDAALLDPLVPRPLDLPAAVPLEPFDELDPTVVAVLDHAKIFAAPDDPADWPRWRQRLTEWRRDARKRSQFDDAAYDDPDTAWASSCFSVALTWLWDERLYHHGEQRFDVDGYLAATADLGGFDAVVLWHAYPVIGIDERNQFDWYRQVPGLGDVVAAFQARGLKVFFDYNPWDTEGAAGQLDHADEMAAVADEFGADGVFLDTMSAGNAELVAALRRGRPPKVLEGETRVSLERTADHQISWAQWFADSPAPGVLRAHWFERGHMLHHTRRWNHDHSAELQSSWMNGTGIVVWDCVFGSWVGWNERDRSTLRAMLRAQRLLAAHLRRADWMPLVDAATDAVAAGVYVSSWRDATAALWTAINRADTDFAGPLLDGEADAGIGGWRWFEVSSGVELAGAAAAVTVPARGIGGVLAVAADDAELLEALDQLRRTADGDSHRSGNEFPQRRRVRVAPPRSTVAPPATAVVVEPGTHELTITSRRRETGLYGGAPWVEEWKPLPPRLHAAVSERLTVTVGPVAVSASEVSAAEWAEYRRSIGTDVAEPVDPEAPATGVGLAAARAYASAAGARLPTEFEWQLAAADRRFTRRAPVVWNWTESEHSDDVTRFAILKGGSAYEPTASDWYFDGGIRPPTFSAKYLLAGVGLDAASTIGFRLAWDLEEGNR